MNKYHAKRCFVDGHWFASGREAARYRELRLLEQAGEIQALRLQPRFDLLVSGHKVGEYRADFAYLERGEPVVEDSKGFRTPMFRWKAKHLAAQYGIQVRET